MKRVQEVARYGGASLDASNLPSGQESLVIQDPVATIVRCDGHIFLCVGEVNGIKVDTNSLCSSISLTDLAKLDNVVVSIQLLGVRPSTSDDDPTLSLDWRSYRIKERTIQVSGRFIEALNPDIMPSNSSSSTFYLFKGSSLVATAATLLGLVSNNNVKSIPEIPASLDFPYRERTGK